MTKSFAIEASPRNIRYNTITPGSIATEMTDVLRDEGKRCVYLKDTNG